VAWQILTEYGIANFKGMWYRKFQRIVASQVSTECGIANFNGMWQCKFNRELRNSLPWKANYRNVKAARLPNVSLASTFGWRYFYLKFEVIYSHEVSPYDERLFNHTFSRNWHIFQVYAQSVSVVLVIIFVVVMTIIIMNLLVI